MNPCSRDAYTCVERDTFPATAEVWVTEKGAGTTGVSEGRKIGNPKALIACAFSARSGSCGSRRGDRRGKKHVETNKEEKRRMTAFLRSVVGSRVSGRVNPWRERADVGRKGGGSWGRRNLIFLSGWETEGKVSGSCGGREGREGGRDGEEIEGTRPSTVQTARGRHRGKLQTKGAGGGAERM